MDERLFVRLAERLLSEPVVMASVLATRGATPRKSGSRMLVAAEETEFSIGGGLAEAQVVETAHALLAAARGSQGYPRGRFSPVTPRWRVRSGERPPHSADMSIDLTGRAGAAGICGGSMDVHLRLWQGAGDRQRATLIAQQLAAGRRATFFEIDDDSSSRRELLPDARLLIVGAGHCARALVDLAQHLDFDLWVQDERESCFADGGFASATTLIGDATLLERAFASDRAIYAVLLNREFGSDVAALRALAGRQLAFLGMMGSRKRVEQVLAECPGADSVIAPVGLDIGAETPHEIAVSILAQVIQVRAKTG